MQSVKLLKMIFLLKREVSAVEAADPVKGPVNLAGGNHKKEIIAHHYSISKIILYCLYYSYRSSVRLRSGSKLSNDFVPDVLPGSVKMFSDQGITPDNVLLLFKLCKTLTITYYCVQIK